MMNRGMRLLAAILFVTIGFLAPGSAGAQQKSLDAMLRPYLAKYELPALAAAVVKNGKITAAGAVGTRKMDEHIPVTIHDRFHLGSDTKAMTSLMAAMLVEQGRLRWNSTNGEVFPELAEKMDPVFKGITVEQMLSHNSGLPSDNLSKDAEPYIKLIEDEASYPQGNLDDIRYWLVRQWSRLPLPGKPGAKFEYSNLNYTILGAMIEKIEGRSWDELIFKWVFKPLKLKTAGLGSQSSLGKVDAALGHIVVDGKIKAMLAGPLADNPLAIGPAGIAHMSVMDFARWAGWNAAQGKRGPHLVKPETMKRLHKAMVTMPPPKEAPIGTPPAGKYGLGWCEIDLDYSSNPVLYHGGSNGMNIARIWFDPKKDFAWVILTNIASKKADAGLKSLSQALFEKYAGK